MSFSLKTTGQLHATRTGSSLHAFLPQDPEHRDHAASLRSYAADFRVFVPLEGGGSNFWLAMITLFFLVFAFLLSPAVILLPEKSILAIFAQQLVMSPLLLHSHVAIVIYSQEDDHISLPNGTESVAVGPKVSFMYQCNGRGRPYATIIFVTPGKWLSRHSFTVSSDSASRALVASSSSKMSGRFNKLHANASRCA